MLPHVVLARVGVMQVWAQAGRAAISAATLVKVLSAMALAAKRVRTTVAKVFIVNEIVLRCLVVGIVGQRRLYK